MPVLLPLPRLPGGPSSVTPRTSAASLLHTPEIHINQIPASPQRLLVPRTENFQEVVSSGPLILSLANGTGNINPSSLQTLQETAQIHPIALGDPVSTAVNLLKVGLECKKKKTVNMQREASYIGFNAGEPIGLRGESWMHGKDLIDHKQATVSSMQSPSNSSEKANDQ